MSIKIVRVCRNNQNHDEKSRIKCRKPLQYNGFRTNCGGRGGIRTHGTLRYTAFRVQLVMTTSILFHKMRSA